MGARRSAACAVADPCRFGWIYPQLLVVVGIVLGYQIITPLIAPFGLAYFSLAYAVYKQQVIYVYANEVK